MMERLRRWLARHKRSLLLFLALLSCYAYFLPRWAEWNQNSRMDLTMAIVEQGTFSIDAYYGNTGDYAIYDGRTYTDKAPGTSFLGVPAYLTFRTLQRVPVVERLLDRVSQSAAFEATLREGGTGVQEDKVAFAAALYWATFFTVAVPSALLGVALDVFLADVLPAPGMRLLLVLGYGLGTAALPYATVFYGHQTATLLLFLAFLLARRVREGRQGPRALWGVGALLGLTVLVEFPALPAAGLLTLYALGPRPHRQLASATRIGLAALPFAVLLGYYNATCFGSPFTSSYRYLANFPEISNYGFLGFGPPSWEAAWGITFSPYRGLFFLSPFLLLALPGFWTWIKEPDWRAEALVALSTVGLHFLIISCWYDWRGGFAIGPRNLLLVLPYMVVAVGFFLRRWGERRVVRAGFVLLVAASWVLTGVAATAGQAFPSIEIARPWHDYWWPRFIAGDITRNLGMAVGLRAHWSLLPPILIVAAVAIWLGIGARTEGARA